MAQFVEQRDGRTEPTDAERIAAVRDLMRQGKSDRKIARHLGISRDELRRYVALVIRDARLEQGNRMLELAATLGIQSD